MEKEFDAGPGTDGRERCHPAQDAFFPSRCQWTSRQPRTQLLVTTEVFPRQGDPSTHSLFWTYISQCRKVEAPTPTFLWHMGARVAWKFPVSSSSGAAWVWRTSPPPGSPSWAQGSTLRASPSLVTHREQRDGGGDSSQVTGRSMMCPGCGRGLRQTDGKGQPSPECFTEIPSGTPLSHSRAQFCAQK